MIRNFDLDLFIRNYVTKRPESLLRPDLEKYDKELKQQLEGKSVLVIGGAGTIGSWYIKALLKYKISKLIVVDTNENALTELMRDLRSSDTYIPREFITYPVNFSDPVFEKIFNYHGPFQVVTNFAAHKHVRSEKDVFSVEAMIENNVLKAHDLIRMLVDAKHKPEHFFCVSTDKATNPVNIMGASKKLMEELIMTYSDKIPITTARFANVAFSNGSLPLGFLERMIKHQPWSCPLGIKRFFVSPRESGELCLLASIIGKSSDIIFPKLDPETDMILFDQIAIDLLKELGFEPDICKSEEEAKRKSEKLTEQSNKYPVYFFESDTSGEKPYEEFHTEAEKIDMQSFINLGVVKNSTKKSLSEVMSIVNQLELLFSSKNVRKEDIVIILKKYLPNFDHIEKGKNLDSRM